MHFDLRNVGFIRFSQIVVLFRLSITAPQITHGRSFWSSAVCFVFPMVCTSGATPWASRITVPSELSSLAILRLFLTIFAFLQLRVPKER